MDGIGARLPLERDDRFGNYDLVTSYVDEVKQNFKNLMLTSPGERMMDPDFGVGLRNFLFEQKDHVMPKIRQRIERQVRKYMPFIRINKILFNHNNKVWLNMPKDIIQRHTKIFLLLLLVP